MEEKKYIENLNRLEELINRLEELDRKKPIDLDDEHREPHHPHPHHPKPPVEHPHHPPRLNVIEEENNLKIDFGREQELLTTIFEDEDTALAIIKLMSNSPVEIQIVLKTIIDLHKKVDLLMDKQ